MHDFNKTIKFHLINIKILQRYNFSYMERRKLCGMLIVAPSLKGLIFNYEWIKGSNPTEVIYLHIFRLCGAKNGGKFFKFRRTLLLANVIYLANGIQMPATINWRLIICNSSYHWPIYIGRISVICIQLDTACHSNAFAFSFFASSFAVSVHLHNRIVFHEMSLLNFKADSSIKLNKKGTWRIGTNDPSASIKDRHLIFVLSFLPKSFSMFIVC